MPTYAVFTVEQGATAPRWTYHGHVDAANQTRARARCWPELRVRPHQRIELQADPKRELARRGPWCPLDNPRVL